jgi:hypothetical protein
VPGRGGVVRLRGDWRGGVAVRFRLVEYIGPETNYETRYMLVTPNNQPHRDSDGAPVLFLTRGQAISYCHTYNHSIEWDETPR